MMMTNELKLWEEIRATTKKYNALRLNDAINYKKYFLYSIITHSTAIEGATLTESETALLFDEGLTAKGKPLSHHLMNEDLKNAYLYAMKEADKKTPITLDLLKSFNSHVMAQTGGHHENIGGSFDSSKGEFRKLGVFAVGGSSYMDYRKVPGAVAVLCLDLDKRLHQASSLQDKYNLSFAAHFNLVTIHPWADGNGRTSRLLMNYIQFYHGITPTKVFQQDRADYISALQKSQETENNKYFLDFMGKQLLKLLKKEILNFEKSQRKSKDFTMLF